MTDDQNVGLERDRIAYWAKIDRDKLDSAYQSTADGLTARCKAEAETHGYLEDPNREFAIQVVDKHTDFFRSNEVVMIADYPVLLTRKQWLIRHIPRAQEDLDAASARLLHVENSDDIAEAIEDIAYCRRTLQSYIEELESLA